MKNLKSCLAALSLVAALLCVTNANAVTPPQETFYALGSSAQFNTFGLAAGATIFAGGPLCGTHHWTQKSSSTTHISLFDPRSSSILNEDGNIWIVWNDAAAAGNPGGIICFDLGIDSIVGVRGYQASGQLVLPSSLVGVADANIVPLLGAGEPLPAQIQSFLNGVTFNVALTDIRPEDAKFASMRAMTAYAAQVTGRSSTGVGYGPFPIGTSIQSSQSSTKANPVDFAIDPGDVDPITGGAVRHYVEISIGAAPLLVMVNKSSSTAGHLGDPNFTGINRFELANALIGGVSRTRELFAASGLSDFALHTFIREPLSGTYNTMEWSVPNSREVCGDPGFAVGLVCGQDENINPANTSCTVKPCTVESGNPLWHIFPNVDSVGNHATRGRCVGTGECVTAVNGTADGLGYAFWGFSTFASKANIKYLSVDGAEPLYSTASANPNGVGIPPQCSPSCPLLSFPNIVNGTYPIWSYYRMMYDATDPTSLATAMVTYAQRASDPTLGIFTDMVPAPLMQVFRSHYAQVVRDGGAAFGPNNGFKSGVPQTGGDAGGAILTIQSELDFIADTGGNQQVNQKQ
ncbi:MAG TPA: hypothetical protein VK699_01235 [Terriglobales bacterium]|jgi:hypothetical protein|nr:hypothetical protein [Terriglobales bacterium]